MNEILFSICVTALITALYKALVPSDKMSSQIKLLVSCFFVLSVMSVIRGGTDIGELTDIVSIDTSYNDYSAELEEMTAYETANSLKRVIGERLSEAGITPEKIYIDVNITDNGSISISEVKLVFDTDGYEQFSQRAVFLTKQITGTKIKVTAELTPQSRRAAKERE